MSIASYMSRHPNQIETWYLAGNCNNSAGLETLVTAWSISSSIRHIWLKRNPPGPSSAKSLFELITKTPNLVTLDLDQTELRDAGVKELFDMLAEVDRQDVIPLRHIYLNANGIGEAACRSIASFLTSKRCLVDSLLSNNPIGTAGALALAKGLRLNSTLLRPSIRSCGLKSEGAVAIMNALQPHPHIMTLDIGECIVKASRPRPFQLAVGSHAVKPPSSRLELDARCRTKNLLQATATQPKTSALATISMTTVSPRQQHSTCWLRKHCGVLIWVSQA